MNVQFKLIQLRDYLNLSRNAFAKKIGCSTTQLNRYEAGINEIPDYIISEISYVFHVNPRYFYEDMQVNDAVAKLENKDKHNSEVAERLKARRLELNLSQKELSVISGVSTSQLSQIESMNYTLSKSNAEKIADALETSTEWLLEGKEEYKEYPVNKKLIEWLWKHPEERRELWIKIKQ